MYTGPVKSAISENHPRTMQAVKGVGEVKFRVVAVGLSATSEVGSGETTTAVIVDVALRDQAIYQLERVGSANCAPSPSLAGIKLFGRALRFRPDGRAKAIGGGEVMTNQDTAAQIKGITTTRLCPAIAARRRRPLVLCIVSLEHRWSTFLHVHAFRFIWPQ
jgi:hypothetical protein